MTTLKNRLKSWKIKIKAAYKGYVVSYATIAAPFLVAGITLRWTQTHFYLTAHIIVLIVFFAILLGGIYLITGDRGAELFAEMYKQQGVLWPISFSISLLIFSSICFASLTNTLNSQGYVSFEPQIGPDDFSKLSLDFYTWHFMDSVPGLKIPETLMWNAAFKYTDRLSGLLLLMFKLSVILPVIKSFSTWLTVMKKEKTGGQEKE
jgi:hypothetical protein